MWNRWVDANIRQEPLFPLYVGAVVAIGAALYAMSGILAPGDSSIRYMEGALIGTAIGFTLRRRPNTRWIGLTFGFIIVIIVISGTYSDTAINLTAETRSAIGIAWLTVALTGGACTADSVLFLLVPALAILVASATESLDSSVTAGSLAYCAALVFSLHYYSAYYRKFRQKSSLKASSVIEQTCDSGIGIILGCVLSAILFIPLTMMGTVLTPLINGGVMGSARSSGSRIRSAGTPSPYGAVTGDSVRVGMGPTQLTYDPVMRVRSSESHLILSRSYTGYTNQGWKDDQNSMDYPAPMRQHGCIIPADIYTRHWHKVRQDILLIGSWDTLPAYPCLAVIRSINARLNPWVDNNGCARIRRTHSFTTLYTAISRVPPALEKLSDGPTGLPAPTGTPVPLLPMRVQSLAEKLRQPDDIETVRHVLSYLASHCSYDLSAPAVPDGRDAVDYFLFDSRSGYCDLFATAAAVLLQIDHIPTRYCIGFLPDEVGATRGVQVITTALSHAWIEVFIQGRGWIPVDPTPPGSAELLSPATKVRDILDAVRIRARGLTITGLIFLLGVFGVIVLSRSKGGHNKSVQNRRAVDSEKAKLFHNYYLMQRSLARAGIPRRRFETPLEFLRRINALGLAEPIIDSIAQLTSAFVEVRYGNEKVPLGHTHCLRQVERAIRQKSVRKIIRSKRIDD